MTASGFLYSVEPGIRRTFTFHGPDSASEEVRLKALLLAAESAAELDDIERINEARIAWLLENLDFEDARPCRVEFSDK